MKRSFLLVPVALFALLFAAPAAGAAVPTIATNYQLICGLVDDGTVHCAGENSNGSLGTGNSSPAEGFQASPVTGAEQIAVADHTACVAKTDKTVWCWGDNTSFELGQGGVGTTDSAVPVQVKASTGMLTGVVQLSGQDHSFCALKDDTTMACWGEGSSGQLGDGGGTSLSLATQVWTGSANLSGVKKAVAGRYLSCALMISGGVKCWGSDSDGELGNGPDPASDTPVDVQNIANAVDLGAGSTFACALISDGTVKCWGHDGSGEMGNGPGNTAQDTAQTVPGLTGVRQISVGYSAACAQVADGSLKCWGSGDYGEFLDPTLTQKDSPVAVPVTPGFVAMSPTFENTPCVLYRGGAASCWGYDEYNQLGAPPTTGNLRLAATTLPVDLVTLAYPGTGTTAGQPAKTKLDKKKTTYRLTTSLTTTPGMYVLPSEACTGAVTASVKYSYYSGKKRKKKTRTIKATGTLGLAGENCTSKIALKLPVRYFNGRKAKVTLSAAGNGSLQPVSVTKTYKLAKVKSKKK